MVEEASRRPNEPTRGPLDGLKGSQETSKTASQAPDTPGVKEEVENDATETKVPGIDKSFGGRGTDTDEDYDNE